MRERVLVVAAHPDDEVFGCGGTIAAHAAAGDSVSILFLANGETARGPVAEEVIAAREAQSREAAEILGALEPRFLRLPDNRLDTVPLLDIIKQVETVVGEIEPTVVYTHHGGDLNIDHGLAQQATLTACRPLPGSTVRAIYTFETPSSTEWAQGSAGGYFHPSCFVDIRAQLAVKARAVAAYAGELRDYPHPRSPEAIMAMARWRGASAGLDAAEAFMTIREIMS